MRKMDFVALSAMLLSACASQIPEQTRNLSSESREGSHRFNGEYVRWGGTIAAIENRASRTWIKVDRCHLSNEGTPGRTHREGRFLALIEGKLNPAIYAKGRHLTVVGDLEDANAGALDEYDYEYPVVNVEAHHLWASLPENRDARAISRGAYSRMPVPYSPLVFEFLF